MSDNKSQGVITQARSYLSESVDELKKVTRPSLAEAKQATFVTIALVVLVALIIALFDLLFSQLMKFLVY